MDTDIIHSYKNYSSWIIASNNFFPLLELGPTINNVWYMRFSADEILKFGNMK